MSGYHARHALIRKINGAPWRFLCEGCCGEKAQAWATVHGRDGMKVFWDFVPLCLSCHARYDSRWRRRRRVAETAITVSAWDMVGES